MKNFKYLLPVFILISLLTSCGDNGNDIDGKWSDNIKLSTRSVEFDKGSNSATITTKNNKWWFSSISTDGIEEPIHYEETVYNSEWFTIEKTEEGKIIISVEENDSNKERQFRLILQNGNYFDYVSVKQK